jgi:hypothetical protein
MKGIVKLKGLSNLVTHVKLCVKLLKVMHQMNHFSVFLVMEEWKHRDTIVNLESKGVTSIINDDNVPHLSSKDSEILYVNPI